MSANDLKHVPRVVPLALKASIEAIADAGLDPAGMEIDERRRFGVVIGSGGAGLEFSLAHAGDRALVAVAWGVPVGVDLEALRTDREFEAMARTVFSEAEQVALAGAPAGEKVALFHRVWTRKEAWLKARGTGFTFQGYEPDEMLGAIRRGLAIHRQPELWTALQKNGMTRDFSWRSSSDGYDRLYAEARARVDLDPGDRPG